eukprot:UN07275
MPQIEFESCLIVLSENFSEEDSVFRRKNVWAKINIVLY